MTKNIFCDKSTLNNESDVEQFFIMRLLKYLGFEDSQIKTKTSIKELAISKGSSTENYKPDYVIIVGKKPRMIIEAKDPKETLDKWIFQPAGYSFSLNRTDTKEDPVKYFILTNGNILQLYEWNKYSPILSLKFDDFNEGNKKFVSLHKLISQESLLELSISPQKKIGKFEYNQVSVQELNGVFRACHNLIWKKEKMKPTAAFYEFSKIFFIKVNEDKRIKELGREPEINDFRFSVNWIEKQEDEGVSNPIDSTLFSQIRENLESEVKRREKKRIFNVNEKINLKPSTIKEVVRLLEHLNLYGVEEDLNGRMFERFLNATIRGKELGQFFTPRSAVEFMVELADLKCNKNHIDDVIDACCGSGGFLIDAMVDMWRKIDKNNSLSNAEKSDLKNEVVTKHLYGLDADKDSTLPISRIARMNMVLHGDGSNKIYYIPDSLDKNINIENGIEVELRDEAEEIKKVLLTDKKQFDVVLTNPPFSMKYEKKKQDERLILDEYEVAHKRSSGELRPSVKSNILFLERYRDLLKPHGKLITIIDESVLNTPRESEYRDFIKDNFIIKAVISLPRNTFVNADTGVKTSIIYLIKKVSPDEVQPEVFMAISENIGHSDSGKPTPKLNDLPIILQEFKKWDA